MHSDDNGPGQQKLHVEIEPPSAISETFVISRGDLTVEHVRLHPHSEFSYSRHLVEDCVALNDFVLTDGEVSLDGMAFDRPRDLRGKLAYIPGDGKLSGFSKIDHRAASFTAIHYRADALGLARHGAPGGPLITSKLFFEKPSSRRALVALQQMAVGLESFEAIRVDAVAMFAIVEASKSLRPPSSPRTAPQLNALQASRIAAYMNDELAQDLTLAELAAITGLTRFHFSRCFKGTFGETPYQYLTRIRILRAKELLASTPLYVSEIAAAVGFHDVTSFSRRFSQYEGISPRRYRDIVRT